MMIILLGAAMYFLPSIIGHNKRGAGGIFLVNLFLGWTIIGWIVALIWACTAEVQQPVVVVTVPSQYHYCCQCGAACVAGARYCSVCGRAV